MAGRARVRQYPRQMVAKMSMEMNTIWLKMMPYLQQQYDTHGRGRSLWVAEHMLQRT